uniref:GRF1-interacting factor 2-like n=1 Tax=Erigeron canadensis TaxID=72917 RepID=UPI001CB9AEF1|nr:GRF1-interacting factor 2-like [Erigeron canadensis]
MQQSPQSQPQQQPPTLNSAPAFVPNAITTEQIQKCLDDNKNLILAILENQNLGKFQECAQYQAVLQKNLMYLAAIADAQPPAPTPQASNPSQMAPNSIPQQANNYMQQQQMQQQQQQQQHQQQQQQAAAASAASQQSQQGGVSKLPFQLNALRPQDQQQQLLQFQQHQQQQMQAQMGMRAGAQNGMLGMHQAMQSAMAGNPMDGRGMKQDGSEAASGGDGQGKSRS